MPLEGNDETQKLSQQQDWYLVYWIYSFQFGGLLTAWNSRNKL